MAKHATRVPPLPRATLLPRTQLRAFVVNSLSRPALASLLSSADAQEQVWHANVRDHRGGLVANFHAFDDPGDSVVIFSELVPGDVVGGLVSTGALVRVDDWVDEHRHPASDEGSESGT